MVNVSCIGSQLCVSLIFLSVVTAYLPLVGLLFVITHFPPCFLYFYVMILMSVAGDRHYFNKKCSHRSSLTTMSTTALGKGGGLLERPTIETTPGRESEFDVRYRH